jgi:hypothetical protein
MKAMSTTVTDLSSIGFVCQTLQQPPGTIRRAAESLGIKPALCINGVAHYDDEQVAAIREQLQSEGK